MGDGQGTNAPGTPRAGATNGETTPSPHDEADLARVAALVARAGLPLTAAEIATLVTEERYDRAGFERLRAMLTPDDETAHTFQAVRVMRHPSGASDPSEPAREARP